MAEKSEEADGFMFGKPVWDFKYPESTFFVTVGRLSGCVASSAKPKDVICVPLGSTYPIILRPDSDRFYIRGYAYVHGIMNGERKHLKRQDFNIL